jgi:hypothetical protein
MRALTWVLVVAAILWGGYWFVGSRALDRAAESWFAQQEEAGLVASNSGLSVAGFPNRFDLTVNDLRLEDPETGLGWSAPFVQVMSLSYKPWHVIAALPNDQQITLPDQLVGLSSQKLQASLVVTPGTALALDRLTVVGDTLRLSSDLGWTTEAETVRFATKQVQPGGAVHEIGLEVLGLRPDAAVTAALPGMPATVDRLHLDAIVEFTAPLDRHAAETQPKARRIEVKDSQLAWGPLALSGTGTVEANADGLAEGRIALRLANWREAVPLAVAAGLLTPEAAPTWENMLQILATQSGDAETLDLPLVFARGRMSLGPLPLGPAPRME